MTIKNFSQYLLEEKSTAYFTFGRMNPPTVGHGKLLDKLASVSKSNPYFVFVSQSQDSKKNPLSYSDKIKHLRKMFPKHGRSILINKSVRNVFDALVHLYEKGFTDVVMVVGADRVVDFRTLIEQYNGKQARHGFYNFKSIDVVSAGQRDPDAEGIEGMSASKQRQNAAENDFASFSQGIPRALNTRDTRKLFNDVRKGMGLSEESEFVNHVSLEPVSERRERYIKGELFTIGDHVVVKESGEIGDISWRGSNYLVVTLDEDVSKRLWLEDVEQLDELVLPDTLAKLEPKLDRFLHRVVNKKAYKKAIRFYINYFENEWSKKDDPEGALWKVAQTTGADFRNLKMILNKMAGAGDIDNKYAIKEQDETAVDKAREKVDKQKEQNKDKYDRILDRARLVAARRKNRET